MDSVHFQNKLVGSRSKIAADDTKGPNSFITATQYLEKTDIMGRETTDGDEASPQPVSVGEKMVMASLTRRTRTKNRKTLIPNDSVFLMI